MNLQAAFVMRRCPDTQGPGISLPVNVHYQPLAIVLKTKCTDVPFSETYNQLVNKFLGVLDISKEAGVHT